MNSAGRGQIRLPHFWEQRRMFDDVSVAARWHLLGIISFCSRTRRYNGVLPLVSALRASDVPDMEGAVAELVKCGALRRLEDGMVEVVGIDEYLPAAVAAKARENATQHLLYRLFAADGTLLYIGRTGNLTDRLYKHSRDKPWWHEVTEQRVAEYPTLAELVDAERDAIVAENPRYNRMHHTPPGLSGAC